MAAWDEGKRAKAKIWMMAGALGVGWIACLSACIANMVVFYVSQTFRVLRVSSHCIRDAIRKLMWA